MKINKISQKILASVLMLAVLICGMFFLTACDLFGGDSDDKIRETITNTLSKMKTDLSQPVTKLSPPVEREKSSIGLDYAGDYKANIDIEYFSYITSSDAGAVCRVIEVINNNQLKEGELYQDSIIKNLTGCYMQFMFKIDKENKTVNCLIKEAYPEKSNNQQFMEIEIKLNDSYTDWVSYIIKIKTDISHQWVITEKGTNNLAIGSFNSFAGVNGDINSITGCDFDTDYYIITNEVSSSLNEFLKTRYGIVFSAIETKINNSFVGKTVKAEIDIA